MRTTAGANSIRDAPSAARLGRALASPVGILIIVPTLVITAGVVVLMLGRSATNQASDQMARRQLAAQAADVQHDVAFALDQADPVLRRLEALADPMIPIAEAAPRMHDLMIDRPGVANVSIGFPSGLMRGTFVPAWAPDQIHVQESAITSTGTVRTNYQIVGDGVRATDTQTTDYDVRKRPHYTLAEQTKKRTWTAPRVYFTSKSTGITCVEPVYAADGSLRAVLTVDFDVGALSKFLVRSPLEGSRSVVFSGDGTILAFPAATVPQAAIAEGRLLRADDYADSALTALFTSIGSTKIDRLQFFRVAAPEGAYLASVAPVGGERGGISTPLDWYLAALVPERTLLAPTKKLEKRSLLASGGALFVALGISVMFAWNLVRMRRDVKSAREAARNARARIKELGAYRLLSKLGVGGMGEVWRAEHRMLAREAAVKLVRSDALADPWYRKKARERFRREAQTLASMRSRHTIELFDYGATDDGTFYYVMELLDGLDLDVLVREYGSQPAARVIQLMTHACSSLAEAHDAGLLHRDIKPANIFVCRIADEVDIAKILDFGIVHHVDDPIADPIDIVSLPAPDAALPPTTKLTKDGAVIGTPGYIPPEQVVGIKADGRSDLYALACVAWWLLTAAEVYPRPNDQAAIRAHVSDPIPPLRPRVKGWLPAELESIIVRCLAKDPNDRPADARELAALLRAVEIPEEHAWTEERALAWWSHHRPKAESARSEIPTMTVEQRLLVPTEEAPAGPELDRPTVADAPRSR